MPKIKALVIGLGEVGRSLFELLKESGRFDVFGFDRDERKMHELNQGRLPAKVDIMHICIPCVSPDTFVNIVVDYINKSKPNLVIINSTVTPGTTANIHRKCDRCLVSHSPARGVHRNSEYMKWELRRWIKYVGGTTSEAGKVASLHFEEAGFKTKILNSSKETELAKLFETTYRAWMIACFQEMHRISTYIEAKFDDVVDFIEDTHRIRLDRPVMFPDVIGGHCLIPNVKLLLELYDSPFLRLILASNDQRHKEIKNKQIRKEIQKIRKRIEILQKDLSNSSAT